jgi:hypothetical protein
MKALAGVKLYFDNPRVTINPRAIGMLASENGKQWKLHHDNGEWSPLA